jgi:mannan endo-1,4-beta-mannosidase
VRARLLFLAVICVIAAAGCRPPGFAAGGGQVPLRLAAPPAVLATTPGRYLGVYEGNAPRSYQAIEQFAAAVGRQPNLALYYSGTRERFQFAFAEQARAHGTVPVIQMEPRGISMAAIAAGRLDTYLRAYANSVREYKHPVIIGFGHEMNGRWYSWGYGHVRPATWVAAWRHVVTVFRARGADNVTWMWTVNRAERGTGPLRPYWPGAQYVNWIGIDGYLERPRSTFGNVFGPTVAAVRRFSHAPVLIAETAVGAESGKAAKIPGMFAGIRQDHLLGMVWFDVAQHQGVFHQDWRLEDDPAAITEFRREAARR